ncbi:hypothetical protein [Psychrobacillus sp. NPDC093180]|uniref:hypothetical protein n=1 Tax=Psychrobacillus sp. NPDC093180 TaxID=3364489 RepID=UPI00380E37B0
MKNLIELEERIKRIEEEIHPIDRLDGTTFELTERLNRAVGLLIRVVEKNEQIDKKDLDYLLLKLRVDANKYYEVPTIINKAAISYKKTGEYPTFYEIHQRITEALSLTEKDKKDFSIEVTESLLKRYMDVEEIFNVCEKILSTK